MPRIIFLFSLFFHSKAAKQNIDCVDIIIHLSMMPKLKEFEKRYMVGKGHMTFSYSAGFERPFPLFFLLRPGNSAVKH